ncbi:heme lyase CcmF/NrfE family subunit [Gammaproteobacteria bacterium]|nr:heme lyase CcmF/NrfE family subunit [Gammaproteobacteria bacterium]
MIPELGHFALLLALALSLGLAIFPALGVRFQNPVFMRTGFSLAFGVFTFMLASFFCLLYAFVNDDFTVTYVANNSNSALPLPYKVSAIWGAHEGSFLLWTLIMSGWTLAVALFNRSLTTDITARVLAVLGGLNVGFLAFLLFASNPFERSLPFYPQDGADLNPLLQDFGLIVHPPMLYMGYVGFAVPFALAIATLTAGRLDSAWARWSRPWTNAAWAFLTIGITLGSWWAYYELGWGGWWFWDAVENASFMPWLVGTALVHSLAASEKRGVFKSWTVLLAIAAFSLSLLGAFLVRSGVLTSVHAFAVDPLRGVFILVFLIVVVGGSLFLYALRGGVSKNHANFSWKSREAFILSNNLILVVSAAAILIGTLYPLFYEVVTDGAKISVGPPYFNAVFIPLMAGLFLFMIFSPFSKWGDSNLRLVLTENKWSIPTLISGVVITSFFFGEGVFLYGVLLNSLAVLMLFFLVKNMSKRTIARSASYMGMILAHGGIALAIIGVVITTYYSEGRDVRMEPGDKLSLSGYQFEFLGVEKIRGPNYISDQGEILVTREGQRIAILRPEKRFYPVAQDVMTEAAMHVSPLRDLYVALGEPVGEKAWAVRVNVKPFVRWIWFGGLLIALGSFVTLFDRRYRAIKGKKTGLFSMEATT